VRRALPLLLLTGAAFACKTRPVIESFTVDEPNPDAAATVTFSFSVKGASTIRIDPIPGVVAQSPVRLVPLESATFWLRAFNDEGTEASRSLNIVVRPPFDIVFAEASPGQVTPGNEVKLTWTTSSTERATLMNETTGEVSDVQPNASITVHPMVTTIYTLTAFNRPGRLPASRTAKMTARVAPAPAVSDFVAEPPAIFQGETSTLSWKGNAVSYSVTPVIDGTSGQAILVGPRRSLVVRPTATCASAPCVTTYLLEATGPGGTLPAPLSATVSVTPRPAARLTYVPATPTAGQVLQLVADPCGSACTTMTFHIVPAGAAVPLRGFAFNLPLDTGKVSFNPSSFAPGAGLSGADARATIGTGPLKDVLVVGIALKGSGTAPAADVDPGAEVAHFELRLVPGGGVGTVFDGSAPGPAYKAVIQHQPTSQLQSGRSAGAIAVGKLDAQ
jgi:hypothetical protein